MRKPLRPARLRAKYPAMTTRTPLAGPSVWLGQDIKDSRRWIRDLPEEALDELDAAVKSVRGMPWQEITREDFALPTISDLLDDVADELENGCGMVKLSLECGALCRGVVGEEVPPGRIDARAVGEVLLVDLVDEPLIGSEPALRHSSRVVAATRPSLRRACPTGAARPARRAAGDLRPRSGPGRARSGARGPRGHPWPLPATRGD